VVVVVEMVDESDVFVVERFDEMLLRRWRGDVVVGVVERERVFISPGRFHGVPSVPSSPRPTGARLP